MVTLFIKKTKILQDCLLYALCTQKMVAMLIQEKLLDKKRKNNEIYKIYKWLKTYKSIQKMNT